MTLSFLSWITIILALVATSQNVENDQGPYALCGKTATCFGLDVNEPRSIKTCTKKDTCDAFVVLVPPKKDEEEIFQFLLRVDHSATHDSSPPNDYVGVGINTQIKMNEMLILECVKEGTEVYGYVSWNPSQSSISSTLPLRIYGGKTPTASSKAIPSNDPPKGLEITAHAEGDSSLCEFFLPDLLPLPLSDDEDFKIRLSGTKYILSVAIGQAQDTCNGKRTGGPGPKLCFHIGPGHGVGKGKDAFKLTEIQSKVKTDFYMFRKLHAFLMVLAYCTLIPTATIMARFFRETWATHHIFNKRIWFTIHASLLYTALICIILAYIFIALSEGRAWPTDRNSSSWVHATVGMASMLLILSQTIIPWLIPARQLLVKRTYSLIHAVVGSVCYFLGLLNIAIAPYLMPQYVNCSIIFIVFLWMGFHFVMYWIFVTLLIIKDHEMINNNSRFRALIAYPMRLKTMDEAPGSKTRMIFFGIFLFLSFFTTIVMGTQIFQESTQCEIYMEQATA